MMGGAAQRAAKCTACHNAHTRITARTRQMENLSLNRDEANRIATLIQTEISKSVAGSAATSEQGDGGTEDGEGGAHTHALSPRSSAGRAGAYGKGGGAKPSALTHQLTGSRTGSSKATSPLSPLSPSGQKEKQWQQEQPHQGQQQQ